MLECWARDPEDNRSVEFEVADTIGNTMRRDLTALSKLKTDSID